MLNKILQDFQYFNIKYLTKYSKKIMQYTAVIVVKLYLSS